MFSKRTVCRPSGESGLTLVELLIAVALLGFILLGIAPLFIASVKSNLAANEYTSIHILARDRLEQLMNLPFQDPQLVPAVHANDQPAKLPDPRNPSAFSNVVNPFVITYQVSQYRIPAADVATVPNGQPFTPTRITAAGATYHYKRIDVTVMAHQNAPLSVFAFGPGARVARVSGCLNNPSPATIFSAVDAGP